MKKNKGEKKANGCEAQFVASGVWSGPKGGEGYAIPGFDNHRICQAGFTACKGRDGEVKGRCLTVREPDKAEITLPEFVRNRGAGFAAPFNQWTSQVYTTDEESLLALREFLKAFPRLTLTPRALDALNALKYTHKPTEGETAAAEKSYEGEAALDAWERDHEARPAKGKKAEAAEQEARDERTLKDIPRLVGRKPLLTLETVWKALPASALAQAKMFLKEHIESALENERKRLREQLAALG